MVRVDVQQKLISNKTMKTIKSEKDINFLVESFDNQTLPHDDWHHLEHIAVAAYYLHHFELNAATEKIKAGIKKLNDAHGAIQTENSGYHETITVFLMKILAKKYQEVGECSLWEKFQIGRELLSNLNSFLIEYYSPELINSWEARLNWVSPDKQDI